MATLPLFDPSPAHPDAWHRVTAPGGYEWWYFDAEDASTDTQVVAIFLEGFVFHPAYLRAYARYRRRPTRVAPPVPRDHVCAYFVIYKGGRIAHQFMTQYPAEEFEARTDRLDVRIGPNRCRADADGAIRLTLRGTPWVLTARGPKTLFGQTLTAELEFRPAGGHPPAERRFLSTAMTGAEHQWVIANPRCEVAGAVRVEGGAAAATYPFGGRGYHDHNYGTAPIGPGLKRWVWGRALFDGRACTFHYARPRDASLPDEVHLLTSDAGGLRDVMPERPPVIDWSRSSGARLAYPAALDFGPHLVLSNPRLVDSSPFYMRLIYDAAAGAGQDAGTAFCEVAYPHRLRWPVLGRMIEMSIHHAAAEKTAGR